MNSDHVEAVVFDLDGVITDTAHYHYLAWGKIAEELDIPFDPSVNENLKGVSRQESLRVILDHGGKEDKFSKSEMEKLASQKNEYYKEMIQELTPEDVLPGIMELITEIKNENIPLGVASASKNAPTVLRALEMDHLFEYCADASRMKRSKPDPEIFLTVCEALEARPEHSIGIEDARVGIEAIKKAGMYAVGVGKNLEEADLTWESTEHLSWTSIKNSFLTKNSMARRG
ncbi:beta-phosphoglucomutase [Halobacillus sp. H74]|uniref:beta-phosphoglucomutase n=1 Tax=Halobacillus sp. H74 TaxID=3457436 RepID=UPI003FCDB9F5